MSNRRLRPIVLLVSFAMIPPAWAGPNDALHFVSGIYYGHDDNLLRVPDGNPGFDNTREDAWRTGEVGLLFDKLYGRQHLFLVAKVSRTHFDHFKELDYDGKDMQANWLWQLGDHLQGKVGTTYREVLAPYTDIASSERNLLTARSRYAEVAWRFHSWWRVRAAFQRDEYEYELASQRYNNRTEDASELEFGYLTGSDSTVGLVVRQVKGRYPYARPVGAVAFNDNFTQDELKLHVKWSATGSCTLDALLGYNSRKQPSFGEDRIKGVAGKIEASYQTSGKMSYNAAVWRDFAPLESTEVSYTLNKGASVGAEWNVIASLKVSAGLVAERRNYNTRGDKLAVAGDVRDSIRTARLQATWSPRPALQVVAGVEHQARSGSLVLGTGSFKSNGITLSSSVQF
jgi:exopolysaccharide biosynthesis operon protein EpsL